MPYVGIQAEKGKVVDFDDALDYVLKRCGLSIVEQTEETQDALGALEEWYFSGDWLYREEDDNE